MVFGMFLAFLILDPTKNFVKAIAFSWAIYFQKRLISKIVGVFLSGFLPRATLMLLQYGFWHVFSIFNF